MKRQKLCASCSVRTKNETSIELRGSARMERQAQGAGSIAGGFDRTMLRHQSERTFARTPQAVADLDEQRRLREVTSSAERFDWFNKTSRIWLAQLSLTDDGAR